MSKPKLLCCRLRESARQIGGHHVVFLDGPQSLMGELLQPGIPAQTIFLRKQLYCLIVIIDHNPHILLVEIRPMHSL